MSCGSCGTSAAGCGSKGNCSTGGCNRLNTYNWLVDIPLTNHSEAFNIVEVSFNNGSRKDFYKNDTGLHFLKDEVITVEGVNGFDVGLISLSGEIVKLQLKKYGIKERDGQFKKILRPATIADIEIRDFNKQREKDLLITSRAIAKQLGLDMKMAEVEIQADGKKATFFYIANDRVDFRELIKIYASTFKLKVEMKQIGARQEAGKVGGIGSCGRELCCSTWLTDFKSVNTTAARYQNLSINQTKLSGQCGRLKCCLNFELDTYLDALHHFPNNAEYLQFERGRAHLVKKDIFKNIMWYSFADSTKFYPLNIDTVNEVVALNKKGIRPAEIETTEIKTKTPEEVEPAYADLVGQISLKTLEKTDKKRREKNRSNQNNVNVNRNSFKGQSHPNNKSSKNLNSEINNGTAKKPLENKKVVQKNSAVFNHKAPRYKQEKNNKPI